MIACAESQLHPPRPSTAKCPLHHQGTFHLFSTRVLRVYWSHRHTLHLVYAPPQPWFDSPSIRSLIDLAPRGLHLQKASTINIDANLSKVAIWHTTSTIEYPSHDTLTLFLSPNLSLHDFLFPHSIIRPDAQGWVLTCALAFHKYTLFFYTHTEIPETWLPSRLLFSSQVMSCLQTR